jgi:hypothetical protein
MQKNILLGLIVIIAVFLAFDFESKPKEAIDEIQKIVASHVLGEQTEYYRALIERVGPEQAQEELYASGLPFDGQTHLLNHTVGKYLYEQFGPSGFSKCKLYFLASCPHGFVIDAVSDGGIPQVTVVVDECRPLGSAAYSQCAHAVGHGLLAAAGYQQLDQALSLCDEVEAVVQNFPSFNCYDGVFMENIWAVHENGEPSPYRWVKDDDLFYPCNDDRIEPKYDLGCWSNQPALMYQMLKGDIKAVGVECAKVEITANRDMCFDGLARQIHPVAKGSVDRLFELCNLLPTGRVTTCAIDIVGAEYSVGGRTLPFAICNQMNGNEQNQCYDQLLGTIGAYADADKPSLCQKINNLSYKKQCLNIY